MIITPYSLYAAAAKRSAVHTVCHKRGAFPDNNKKSTKYEFILTMQDLISKGYFGVCVSLKAHVHSSSCDRATKGYR